MHKQFSLSVWSSPSTDKNTVYFTYWKKETLPWLSMSFKHLLFFSFLHYSKTPKKCCLNLLSPSHSFHSFMKPLQSVFLSTTPLTLLCHPLAHISAVDIVNHLLGFEPPFSLGFQDTILLWLSLCLPLDTFWSPLLVPLHLFNLLLLAHCKAQSLDLSSISPIGGLI